MGVPGFRHVAARAASWALVDPPCAGGFRCCAALPPVPPRGRSWSPLALARFAEVAPRCRPCRHLSAPCAELTPPSLHRAACAT
eukprot:1985883-Pyramimonas_sp.AAC.1